MEFYGLVRVRGAGKEEDDGEKENIFCAAEGKSEQITPHYKGVAWGKGRGNGQRRARTRTSRGGRGEGVQAKDPGKFLSKDAFFPGCAPFLFPRRFGAAYRATSFEYSAISLPPPALCLCIC